MAQTVQLDFAVDTVTSTTNITAQIAEIMNQVNRSGVTNLKIGIDTSSIATIKEQLQNLDLSGIDKKQLSTLKQIANVQAAQSRAELANDKVINAELAIKAKRLRENAQTVTSDQAQINKSMSLYRQLGDYMQRYSAGFGRDSALKQQGEELLKTMQTADFRSKGVQKQQAVFNDFTKACRDAGVETLTLKDRLQSLFGQHLSTALVMAGIHLLQQSLRQVWQNVVDINTALTDLQIVTNSSSADLTNYFDKAAESAQLVGKSIKDVIESTTTYARLGYSANDSAEMARLTAMYSTAGSVDTTEATTGITSLVKAFNIGANDLQSALDKMVYVGNNFPISTAELAEGIGNAGSALAASNNSVEQTLGLMTAANASIQNVSKSSTGLRTIAARIRNATSELEDLGETMDASIDTTAKYQASLKGLTGVDILEKDGETFKSTYDILSELSDKWGELSDIDKSSVANMLSGVRQQNIFASIMNNFQDAKDAVSEVANAEGTLDTANSIYLNSIEGRLNQLKATFEAFSNSILNSQLVSFVVQGITTILGLFNGIPAKIALVIVAVIALNKAVVAFKGMNLLNVGRHKMICLTNMLTNRLMVTLNELQYKPITLVG